MEEGGLVSLAQNTVIGFFKFEAILTRQFIIWWFLLKADFFPKQNWCVNESA